MRALVAVLRALVVRHAFAHRTRTLLTLASIAVGVGVLVAIRLANASAVASFSQAAHSLGLGPALEIVSTGDGIPEGLLLALQRVPGIAANAPVVTGTVTDEHGKAAYDLLGIDLLSAFGLASQTRAPQLSEREHIALQPQLLRRGEIIVAASLAQRWHARAGGRLRFVAGTRPVALRVGAIVPDRDLPPGLRSTVLCDLSTAQDILNRRGQLDRIDVIAAPGTDASRLRRALSASLPPGVVLTDPGERAAQTAKMTEAFRFNLAALATIALLVGSYLVFNAVSISVVQRRPEIGVARALGTSRRIVFTAFLIEGCMIGALGSAAGILFGRLLAAKALGIVTTTIDSLYTTVTGATLVNLPAVYLQTAALGIGLSMLAAVAPAIEAASIPPSMAVRVGSWEGVPAYSQRRLLTVAAISLAAGVLVSLLGPVAGRPVFGYVAALLIVFAASVAAGPLLMVAASMFRRALGARRGAVLELMPLNIQARVRRNALAVATLMVGVAMTVSVATLIASFRQTVITWISQTVRGDLYISALGAVNAADVPMPSDKLPALRHLKGVAAVDALRVKALSFRGRLVNIAASDIAVTGIRSDLPLLGGGDWRRTAGELSRANAVVVSEPFMRKFGIRNGDTLSLNSAHGTARFAVAGVYRDYASDLGTVLMDRARYRALYADDRISAVAVYAAAGADIPRLRASVERIFAPERVSVTPNGELRAAGLQQFDRTFAVTYALDGIALIASLFGIATALGALVVERRQEIAVLRVLGMTRAQVRGMIVGEAALLGTAGGVLGIAAGYALAVILIYVINRQAFGWTIAFAATPWYDVRLLLVVVVTAVLAGIVPASGAARLPLAETLRSE